MTSYTKFENLDLNAYRGDRETYTFNVKDATGAVVNLAGQTIKAEARANIGDVATLFSITVTDAVSGNDFANGVVVLILPEATTLLLPTKSYYDIQATSGSTGVTTLARGRITTFSQVTT